MEAFEPIRDAALRLHEKLTSAGIDALNPINLVEAAARELDVELVWLAPGSPTLKGGRMRTSGPRQSPRSSVASAPP
jgi:DNA helicase II / ATP-dependent DNA helicase PcrA